MLAAGSTLGPYKIVAPLGSGGMGEVYRAHDPRLGRDVAIKVLPAEYAGDADRLCRFEQEARAAGALNHPNVCAIHDVGTHAGAPFVVMELLEGESLRGRLAAGSIPARKTIDYAAQAALGLAAAHEKGIVHRDLKPENLFITRDGHVKILDFGLAKQRLDLPSGPQSELATRDMVRGTEPGIVLGTVGYMSPEQVRGERADARSDIFSFGCVLYEMIGGRQPFKKHTAVETLSAILNEDPLPLVSYSGPVSRAVERVVTRCLQKRAEDRFASAQELHFALQSVLQLSELDVAAEKPSRKAIVVLPFENLSPNPENAYFADGLTEEIISDLAKVRALRVISRTSAMLLRGSKKDVPTIARDLSVRYVLEGSVRRAGRSLRITAQLIDALEDEHLWAEKYTGTFEDVFDMQESVSRAIVEALELELTDAERTNVVRRRTASSEAYTLYLRARHLFNQRTASSIQRSVEYYLKAIEIDGRFALAFAGLAEAYETLGSWRALPLELAYSEARRCASTSVELDASLAEGQVALGTTRMFCDWDWQGAQRAFERALSINPSCADAHHMCAHLHSALGRPAEALVEMDRALELEPAAPGLHSCLAEVLFHAGRYDEAVRQCGLTLEMAPNFAGVYGWMGMAHVLSGRVEVGLEALQEGLRQRPDDPRLEALLGAACAMAGRGDEARACLERLASAPPGRYVDPYYMMWPHVALGDTEAAISWLTRALEAHSPWIYLLMVDPLLKELRSDPKFTRVAEKAPQPG